MTLQQAMVIGMIFYVLTDQVNHWIKLVTKQEKNPDGEPGFYAIVNIFFNYLSHLIVWAIFAQILFLIWTW